MVATPTRDGHAHRRWSRPPGLWLLSATSWSQPPGSGGSPLHLSCPVQGRPPRGLVCREELRWGHSQGYGHTQGGPQLQRHTVPHIPTQRLVVMDTRSHGGIQPIWRDSVTATATTQPFVSDIHRFQEQLGGGLGPGGGHYTSRHAHTHTSTRSCYRPACRPPRGPVRVPTSLGPLHSATPAHCTGCPRKQGSAGSSPQEVGEVFLVTINLPSNFSPPPWHIQLVSLERIK